MFAASVLEEASGKRCDPRSFLKALNAVRDASTKLGRACAVLCRRKEIAICTMFGKYDEMSACFFN
eukprot:12922583-Prorocentrum_lima.AAC.1